MINSFNSWTQLTESIGSGKEVMIDPVTGKRHKVTYKIQTNHKFVMKTINDRDILDDNQKLTEQGITSIIEFFNAEIPFTKAIGELSPSFFTNNFIVYTVLADGELFGRTKQKIQFEVIERTSGIEGMPGFTKNYPNIPDTVQFIDADSFNSLSKLAPQIVSQLKQDAQAAQLPDPKPEEAAPAKSKENEETKKEIGKRFLYTMRTNSKLYMMEFTPSGTISAKTEDGSDPNGTVSYDSSTKKVMWNTTLDDAASKESKVQKNVGTPLFTDSEITNPQDKEFFEKIFTDEAFRRKIIEDYEKEYGGFEITPGNLKKMLFFKNGKPIFPTAGTETSSTQTATTPESGADQVARAVDSLVQLKNKVSSQFYGENPPAES
jgi:hypothetical protein